MEITLHNRQRKLRFALDWLRRFAPLALEECLKEKGFSPPAPLPGLPEVEVTFVSDSTIAGVHRRFMGIPGPTDVITFDHGEIVISAETAQANAVTFGRPLEQELALYIIHGLLHLNGFDDKEPAASTLMHRTQESILARCLARCKTKGK